MRLCIGCGQTDDHPRHIIVLEGGEKEVGYHMDCHVAQTGCELCATSLAPIADGTTGDALRAELVKEGN